MSTAPPISLLAELTHRCPLTCPYCSNPLELARRADELEAEHWLAVIRQAAALGVLHLHLSGGEPLARADLTEIVAAAREAGLYTNLITSAIGLSGRRLGELRAAGLDHVQISIQGTTPGADDVAGRAGAQEAKADAARRVVAAGLPLTINAVVHRHNIREVGAMIELALAWGARRIEVAHVQYHGWALVNRASLLPSRGQVRAAVEEVELARERYRGRIVIDSVVPDVYARRPKRCLGGWAAQTLVIEPTGLALPCHAARSIPGLEFWSVREHALAEIWQDAPAFRAFRGTDWMAEPCRSCPERERDLGGCRCQAFALTGEARRADPVCALSPDHGALEAAAAQDAASTAAWRPRVL